MKRLFYLCSDKIDADQLHGYRKADLRLCFRICQLSHNKAQFNQWVFYDNKQIILLISP